MSYKFRPGGPNDPWNARQPNLETEEESPLEEPDAPGTFHRARAWRGGPGQWRRMSGSERELLETAPSPSGSADPLHSLSGDALYEYLKSLSRRPPPAGTPPVAESSNEPSGSRQGGAPLTAPPTVPTPPAQETPPAPGIPPGLSEPAAWPFQAEALERRDTPPPDAAAVQSDPSGQPEPPEDEAEFLPLMKGAPSEPLVQALAQPSLPPEPFVLPEVPDDEEQEVFQAIPLPLPLQETLEPSLEISEPSFQPQDDWDAPSEEWISELVPATPEEREHDIYRLAFEIEKRAIARAAELNEIEAIVARGSTTRGPAAKGTPPSTGTSVPAQSVPGSAAQALEPETDGAEARSLPAPLSQTIPAGPGALEPESSQPLQEHVTDPLPRSATKPPQEVVESAPQLPKPLPGLDEAAFDIASLPPVARTIALTEPLAPQAAAPTVPEVSLPGEGLKDESVVSSTQPSALIVGSEDWDVDAVLMEVLDGTASDPLPADVRMMLREITDPDWALDVLRDIPIPSFLEVPELKALPVTPKAPEQSPGPEVTTERTGAEPLTNDSAPAAEPLDQTLPPGATAPSAQPLVVASGATETRVSTPLGAVIPRLAALVPANTDGLEPVSTDGLELEPPPPSPTWPGLAPPQLAPSSEATMQSQADSGPVPRPQPPPLHLPVHPSLPASRPAPPPAVLDRSAPPLHPVDAPSPPPPLEESRSVFPRPRPTGRPHGYPGPSRPLRRAVGRAGSAARVDRSVENETLIPAPPVQENDGALHTAEPLPIPPVSRGMQGNPRRSAELDPWVTGGPQAPPHQESAPRAPRDRYRDLYDFPDLQPGPLEHAHWATQTPPAPWGYGGAMGSPNGPYPSPGFSPPGGYGPPAAAPSGYFPPGYGAPAFPPGGQVPGYPPGGYAQGGYPPAGYPPTGYPPAGYPPTGYPPGGYPPAGYPPTGYPPAGYPPSGYSPTGHAPPGYGPPGYGPPGYGPPGYGPPGYGPPGYGPPGFAPGQGGGPPGYPPQGAPPAGASTTSTAGGARAPSGSALAESSGPDGDEQAGSVEGYPTVFNPLAGAEASGPERRRLQRIVSSGRAWLELSGRTWPGALVNLSREGAQLRLGGTIPTGVSGIFSFELPGMPRPISVVAKVMWAGRLEQTPQGAHCTVGVSFERIPPEALPALMGWLQSRGG